MKVKYSVVLFLAALATTHCYPADKKDEKEVPVDKDVDFVPLDRRPGVVLPPPGGVVDIDAGGDGLFGNPFVGNPFPSLLNSIEGLMARMRQQLSQILGRLPEKPGESPFPELHIPNLGDIDLGKGNTTSVTKIIDGHKVTINETEYKQDGDNGAAFFKVRVIDVQPDSDEDSSTEKNAEVIPPQSKPDRESVEDTVNNEIPKIKDNEALNFENIETFDEVDLVPPHKYVNTRKTNELNNVKSIESIEDNNIDSAPRQILHELSNDIYVNQLMADAGAPTNPDAEIFEVVDGHMPVQYNPLARSEKIMSSAYYSPESHIPGKIFQRVDVPHGPMPAFAPLPLPYYAPSMFPVNRNPYNEQYITHSSLPMSKTHQYLPIEQVSAIKKTKKEVEVTKTNSHDTPTSNKPEASSKQSPLSTNVQVPSTST